MEEIKKIKKQKGFIKIIGYIVDVVVYPIIILAFISSFFMMVSRGGKTVTPLFGYGFVRILSGSMINSGFQINDVVIAQTTDTSTIRVGDIIAYYDYNDRSMTKLTPLYNGKTYKDEKANVSGLEVDENGVPIYNGNLYKKIKDAQIGTIYDPENQLEKLQIPQERDSKQVAIEKSSKVNFHMVVNIYVDQTGTLYFETRGTSNTMSDMFKVREDLVAGKYINTPKEFKDFVRFCSSTQGMLILVVLPLSIIVFLELLSVLEQINNLLLEKKVLKRHVKITEKEVEKANIGIEMREYDKCYYYDVMPPDKKQEVFEFLWGYQKQSKNKKLQKNYQIVSKATEVYDFENPEKYWNFFVDSQNSQGQKLKFRKAEQFAKDNKYLKVDIAEYSNNEQQIKDQEKIKNDNQSLQKQVVENQQQNSESNISNQSKNNKKDYDEKIEEVLKRAESVLKNKNKK